GLGVDHVLDLVLAGHHELAQVAADAHVAVAGAGRTRGLEPGVGQLLLDRHVQGGHQLLGGHRLAEPGRQRQAADAKAAQGQEITSLHGAFSGRWGTAPTPPRQTRRSGADVPGGMVSSDSVRRRRGAQMTFGTSGRMRGRRPQPSERAVLITFWPSKRAVAAPCETAETWLGWPLPSKNEPPRR